MHQVCASMGLFVTLSALMTQLFPSPIDAAICSSCSLSS